MTDKKRTFKPFTPPLQANTAAESFITAAPFQSTTAQTKSKTDVDGQLHVLMPKSDIVSLKRAALDRGKTVSDLVREAVKMYTSTD